MPVTLRNNEVIRSWFDIREVRFEGDEDGPGIEKAAAYIRSLIENEIQVNKVESNRIVLAGYSQGAILTLYTALTHDKPLGGAVAISGWLPLAKRFPADVNEANKQIHFFQMHGDQDEVVPIQVFRQSRAYVENNHIADFTFKVYSGMGHDPSKELLEDVQNYINQL